ncbi:MAG: hypothetical protein AAF483_16605 [Planctomycetota bacterium]
MAQNAKHGRMRMAAFCLIAAPFLLAFPLRYWAFHYAGAWFVSEDLEPEHRQAFLGLMHLGLTLAVSVLCFFAASILLWRDRFYPAFSASAAILFGLLAIPAGIFLAIGLKAFLRFG